MILRGKESDYLDNIDFNKPLREIVPFRFVLYLNNMVKTTLSTAFISMSTICFTSYCASSNFIGVSPEITLAVAIILLICGLANILIIDRYKLRKKVEELNIIDAKHDFRNKQLLEELESIEEGNRAEIKKQAAEIALKIMREELENYGECEHED